MINVPTPIHELSHPLLDRKKVRLMVKRDDLIHPEIMGNKWRKLKYNLAFAKKERQGTLLTFGGAYSNHIYAVASACYSYGFKSIGIIRGEELNEESNATLRFAREKGMCLRFVERKYFRQLRDNPNVMKEEYPDAYILPEGGTNELAIKGVAELISEIDEEFDVIVAPIGTGGTFCGLLSGAKEHQNVIGISSLKGSFIHDEVEKLIARFKIKAGSYQILDHYHFGGYGKTSNRLTTFTRWFENHFNIQLDPVYTSKSFYALWNMIEKDMFDRNTRIVILHTGGLRTNKIF